MSEYDLFGRVREIIFQRKIDAEQIAEKNLNVAKLDEKFLTLYKKAKALIFDIGKARFLKSDTAEKEQELKAVKEKIALRLADLNIKKEEIKPQYSCKICNDNADQSCDCFKKELTLLLLEKSGMSGMELPSFSTTKFDFISNEKQRENNKKIYQIMQEYVDKLQTSKYKIVTIVGNVGTGKSHLLQCVVNDCIEKGKFVIYNTAFGFNREMLKYHCETLSNKNFLLEPYLSAELLIIDDLGSENLLKNVTIEYLYLILNERCTLSLPTIITTNLSVEQIASRYDDRIASRMFNNVQGLPIMMKGEDLRQSFNRKN